MKTLTYIFVFAVLIRIGVNTKDKSEIKHCLTARNSPQNPNTPCILPFKLRGQWQNECLPHPGGLEDQFWCATKTNEKGEYVNGQWGICSPECIQTTQKIAKSKSPTTFSTKKDGWKGKTTYLTKDYSRMDWKALAFF